MTSIKRSKNRNPVKQLFITFPKSNVSKHEFRDTLLKFNVDYYKIVEEKHKDGTPHLHALIRLRNAYSCAHILKKFKEYYPNDNKRIDVEPVRSIKHASIYLSKEDKNPLESGQFESNRTPQLNYLNKYAREFGFNSLDHLLNTTGVQTCHLTELKDQVLNLLDYKYNPENVQSRINILLYNTWISKDDITFLTHHFNFKH